MDKKFLAILGVSVLVLVGIFVFSSNKSGAPSTETNASPSNHSIGKLDSRVEVIEYADFQCPACAQFHPLVKQVEDKYKDTVKFTYRHFPIESIHPNARAASRAAEAAGLQGKFFEMQNILFENQQSWASLSDPKNIFDGYATELQLDMTKFKADYVSELVNSTINADLQEGQKKGVSGTPTFFIAGVKVENADLSTLEQFSTKIDEALKNAN